MRMKAAVLLGVRQPLVVEEVELDPPKAGEVLVKMVATGVCHSDLHVYTGDLPRKLPVVLGHEGAGIVEKLGPGVTGYQPGDHVVLTYLPACGDCPSCHTGHPNMCDLGAKLRTGLMLDDTTRLHRKDGTDISSFLFVSTFAEYSVVPA
ncbi:MAG TPA: alcohol dehydrogenase catalytic domain-containing protein, partial [bacterium]|nr:alcohol dehydrogenase catalytic domain-containing protein [bacterium]